MYSHDTMGLGHIRRNHLIAKVISTLPCAPEILLIAGTPEAVRFPMSKGVDCFVLPSLFKDKNGQYRPKRFHMSLDEFIQIRRKMILSSIKAFQPDIFIVDNVPWGVASELNTTLQYLKSKTNTQSILGLRDVLDDPDIINSEWHKRKNEEAIKEYYNEIWVYGDPKVYNLAEEYNFADDIVKKIRYVGYLDQTKRPLINSQEIPASPFALCLVGGGQDGGFLAESFIQAKMPNGLNKVLITGPHMQKTAWNRINELVIGHKNIKVLNFVPEPSKFLQSAECIVSMGGYNTVCEILSFQKKALIVPRVEPRKEQLIRVSRLMDLGYADMIHPNELKPEKIGDWVLQNVNKSIKMVKYKLDMNGLSRISNLVEKLVDNKKLQEIESSAQTA